jgi:hypothetical protein
MEQDEFDNTLPTVIYVHGFIETMQVESIKVVAEAYLKRGDHSKCLIFQLDFTFLTILFLQI